MNFDDKRRTLYNQALEFSSEKEITNQFKKEFWELIEYIIISLYENENSFFGQFLIQVKREISLDIKWPLATKPQISQFIIYFNPVLLLECTQNEVQSLLKHEVYHIMMNHYTRENALREKYSKLAVSIAMDISINQYIKNLPSYCKRLNGVNLEYNLELNQDMTMEKYAEEIQKSIEYRKRVLNKSDNEILESNIIDQESAHDIWSQAGVSIDNLSHLTKKVAINAYNGKAPKDIEKIILLMKEKPEIKWSQLLKNLIPSTKSGYRKTITRKDRRMPERLDLRGKLPRTIPKLLIAIDISASMSDKDIEKIVIEVLNVIKNKNAEVTIIECDDKVRRVYDLKSIKDLKPRVKKNGSTRFSPVFKYIKEHNMRDYILVYFTDGVGENNLEVKPINYKTLWVLTGEDNLSLINSYGAIKKLNNEKQEKYGNTYGLEALRESIHDWAR